MRWGDKEVHFYLFIYFYFCIVDWCSAANAPAEMKITDSVLRSFRVARTYRENSQKVNCVDYSPSGESAISSSDDDSIVLYDIREGK